MYETPIALNMTPHAGKCRRYGRRCAGIAVRKEQLFPGGIAAEGLPMRIPGGHIFKAGHIHEVGHVGPGQDGSIKKGVEAQFLKQRDFSALVEHLHFIGKILFCRTFVAAEFVDPVGAEALRGPGGCMVRHVGKGLEEDRFDADIGRIVIAGVQVGFAIGQVLCVFGQ